MNGLKFVFCEGADDVAVVKGLAESIGATDLIIEKYLGKNNLGLFLRSVKLRPEFAQHKVGSMGIIRDADHDAAAAFRSVCDALRINGFTTPAANGAFEGTGFRVGVLIVGPNGGQGMIEDLCLNSVSDRPEFRCVDGYFRCIAEKCERKQFSSKARVRVWMSSHEDFEFYVGKAAEKGYWPWQSSVFEPMGQFLRAS